MFRRIADWLDDRTGCRKAVHEVLYRRIPGGARWRYVWGTTLIFAVFVEFVTGLFLWMHYSPSTQTAWESVYYIQYEMSGGSLLRGLHHYMAQALMVLLALHLMQVVIAGAYRAPREVNHWTGLALMATLLVMGQTGYLLPWDQRGYHATQVATNIAGVTPVVGDQVKAIAIGGSEFGHHTLTRFFALHAGLLPALLLGLLMLHVAIGRRHGVTAPVESKRPDTPYWPDQALRDGIACLAVLGTVGLLATQWRADLGPPSDPTVDFNSARPEWYFLFLFQLLSYFKGASGMFIAAQLIPGLLLLGMALMPFVGRWKLGRSFNVVFLFALLASVAGLTGVALYEDYNGKTDESKQFLAHLALGHDQAERARELASMGIPIEGAKQMLRDDPKAAGYQLFQFHCAACHDHYDAQSETIGDRLLHVQGDEPTASNLYGFGSRQWVEGMLDPEKIAGPHYFGRTLLAEGEMVEWVKDYIGDVSDLDESEKKTYAKQVKAVAWALSAEAKLPYQRDIDQRDQAQISVGNKLAIEEFGCIDCHKMGDQGDLGTGPDLTSYGSHDWLLEFLKNPHAERFYYSKENYDEVDRLMPAYAAHADDPKLSDHQLHLLTRWLRQDWPMPVDLKAGE